MKKKEWKEIVSGYKELTKEYEEMLKKYLPTTFTGELDFKEVGKQFGEELQKAILQIAEFMEGFMEAFAEATEEDRVKLILDANDLEEK